MTEACFPQRKRRVLLLIESSASQKDHHPHHPHHHPVIFSIFISYFLVKLRSTERFILISSILVTTHSLKFGLFIITLKLFFLGHLVTKVFNSVKSSMEDLTLLFLPLGSLSFGSSSIILLITSQTLVGLFFLLMFHMNPSVLFLSVSLLTSFPPLLTVPISSFLPHYSFYCKTSTHYLLSHIFTHQLTLRGC